MENPQLEDLLMKFVREKESLSADELSMINDPANLQYGVNHLITVKRDVESQFIAYATRIKDFFADCEAARRNNTLVNVEVDVTEAGHRVKRLQSLPPSEAYAKFTAKEGRWKVKNVRFLSLIEAAIADLKTVKPLTVADEVTV
jgi:hypothetical protein